MNRKARRANGSKAKGLVWGKVVPQGTYAELGNSDARDLLVQVFRSMAGPVTDEVFDDERLFDSTMLLIKHNLLTVWFAIDGTSIRVRSELAPIEGAA